MNRFMLTDPKATGLSVSGGTGKKVSLKAFFDANRTSEASARAADAITAPRKPKATEGDLSITQEEI